MRPKLSFANVVSVLALFVALGGTAFAASQLGKNTVGSKQLKKNAVTTAKIKNKAVTGAKIKPETITGTQVKKQSLTGKQVVGSSLSGVSASSLSSVTYVASTVTLAESFPDSTGTPGTATCPPGTKVIGGGATVSDEAEGFVNDSGPTSDRNSWKATGFAANTSTTMTVTAICTAVTASSG